MSVLATVSMKLVRATKEMKKAKWYYDSGLHSCYEPLSPPPTEIDAAWDEYKMAQRLVNELQERAKKIVDAEIEVAKARWWLNEGVSEDSHETALAFAYPFDKHIRNRRDEALDKARGEYLNAVNALEALLAEPRDVEKDLSDAEEACAERVRELRREGMW